MIYKKITFFLFFTGLICSTSFSSQKLEDVNFSGFAYLDEVVEFSDGDDWIFFVTACIRADTDSGKEVRVRQSAQRYQLVRQEGWGVEVCWFELPPFKEDEDFRSESSKNPACCSLFLTKKMLGLVHSMKANRMKICFQVDSAQGERKIAFANCVYYENPKDYLLPFPDKLRKQISVENK